MFYNLLNFPTEDAVPNRIQFLELILGDYEPDLFMVCELNNEAGADNILTSLQFINPEMERAVFEFNTSDDNGSDQNDLQNLIYYDSSKFELEAQAIVTTIFRDFNHYKLKIKSIESATDPVFIDVFVCHLKASSGSQNEALRFQMVEDLTDYLATLPSDLNVVLAGDLNVYEDTEPAFQELIDPTNNIVFVDPADRIGQWHTNPFFIDVMTQSTRTQSGLGGAGGGFDDRFDFIMTSENMLTNPEIKYVANSYKIYGNNNNPECFNRPINSFDCSGADYPFSLRDALHDFSDHLPVTLELETNQSLSLDEIVLSSAIKFIGSNVVNEQIRLKIAEAFPSNTLEIRNQLGQLITTISVKNKLYLEENVSYLSNGLYYIATREFPSSPLKFIKAN